MHLLLHINVAAQITCRIDCIESLDVRRPNVQMELQARK